jgi:hypothetical protein
MRLSSRRDRWRVLPRMRHRIHPSRAMPGGTVRVLNFASRRSPGSSQVRICWQTVRESSCSERTVQRVVNLGPDEESGSSPNRGIHPCAARNLRPPRMPPTSIAHRIVSISIELQAAESTGSKVEPASFVPDLPRAGGAHRGCSAPDFPGGFGRAGSPYSNRVSLSRDHFSRMYIFGHSAAISPRNPPRG